MLHVRSSSLRFLLLLLLCNSSSLAVANPIATEASTVESPSSDQAEHAIDELKKPIYTPFIERYILDELKQLRIDLTHQRVEIIQQITDRELKSVDRGVTYATDTITYFFYLIAAASSVFVLVGWNSLRDIKDKVHTLADEEISRIVKEYEGRLMHIEKQLNQKTRHIRENKAEIERTQEIQSLWLRAGQDNNIHNKIGIYDQILKLRPEDCEAITYKADAVLELHEPQWAANLCRQALVIDPQNAHAFYQLACATTAMGRHEEAISYLRSALEQSDTYKDYMLTDEALVPLHKMKEFKELTSTG